MKTTIVDSAEVSDWEVCTYTTREEVCGRNRDGKYECRIETVEHRGTQDVRYFDRWTEEELQGRLTTPNNAADLIGNMKGQRNSTDRIYTYKGICYRG